MGCRCYERLQPNTKEFTRLTYTLVVSSFENLDIPRDILFFHGHGSFPQKNFQEMTTVSLISFGVAK
jgi:hypothetical protein